MALLSTRSFGPFSTWSPLSGLEREMNDWMRAALGSTAMNASTRAGWRPALDVFERSGDLVVRAELPGVDPERDVEISVADGILTIRGERRAEQRDEGTTCLRMESTYGSFERRIRLPKGVDPDAIRAQHRNGVLEVVVPRVAAAPEAKRIPIQLANGAQGAQQAITAESTATEAGTTES